MEIRWPEKTNIEAPHRQSGQKKKNLTEKLCIDKVARKALWRQDSRKKHPPDAEMERFCWAVQVGMLTPLTFAQHRLRPLAAFTSGANFLHNERW